MFLRPKLTQADLNLSDYADAGASGSTRRALPNSYSAKVTWRTSDTTGTGTLGELNTYVQAITQVGNTVFTGGDFAWVENAATGEKVQQKFLAGYDVTTGELVRTFMPTFNGQIKALEALPNGTLAVGGEFTEVNGEKVAGLVILTPLPVKSTAPITSVLKTAVQAPSPAPVPSMCRATTSTWAVPSRTWSTPKPGSPATPATPVASASARTGRTPAGAPTSTAPSTVSQQQMTATVAAAGYFRGQRHQDLEASPAQHHRRQHCQGMDLGAVLPHHPAPGLPERR